MKFNSWALVRTVCVMFVLATLIDAGGFPSTTRFIIALPLGFLLGVIDPIWTPKKEDE